jgi:hypothetical protein
MTATTADPLAAYQDKQGKIFEDIVALQLLLERSEGMLHNAVLFLGYNSGSSAHFQKKAATLGVHFKNFRHPSDAARGPISEWPIEAVDEYYTRICNSAGRAKEVHIVTDADEVCLANFSDVHIGPCDVAYLAFKAALAQVASEPDTWTTWNGDNYNMSVGSGVGLEGLQGELPIHVCSKLLKYHLDAIKARIAYIGEGNHEERLKKKLGVDMPVNMDLANRLGIEERYIGYCGYVRWHITHRPTGTRQVYVQYYHHGHGGGRAVGAPLNKLRELAEANEADFYMMGHLHRESIAGLDKRYLDDEGQIRIKGRLLVALRSFQQLLDSNYAGKAGYRVNTPGIVRVWLGSRERMMRSEIVR